MFVRLSLLSVAAVAATSEPGGVMENEQSNNNNLRRSGDSRRQTNNLLQLQNSHRILQNKNKRNRNKRNRCSYDADFRTGDGIYIAAAGCPGKCMEMNAGNGLRMDLCKSGDGSQRFSITAAAPNIYGDPNVGFNIVGRYGECVKPETCTLPEDTGGHPLPVNLETGNCRSANARWVDRGGILVNYGCLLAGGNYLTALSAYQCTPMATPFATVLDDSLFFLDECSVQDVNGFDTVS